MHFIQEMFSDYIFYVYFYFFFTAVTDLATDVPTGMLSTVKCL